MAKTCFDTEKSALFNFVVRDGNGVKGLVDSGISKVPNEYIQPPNERILEKTANRMIRLHEPIDLSLLDHHGPSRDQVAESIVEAAASVGFFQVVNHGVPTQLLDSLKDSAHRFFNQTAEEKAVYLKEVSPSPYVKYGTSFVPDKEKALEWKDYVSMVYTNDEDAINHWPNVCKEAALEYMKKSTKMVKRILEVLIGHLGVPTDDEDEHSTVQLVDALIGLKMVNINFYPTCPDPDLTVGVGRHSDMGTLTALLQDGIGGLYVKLEQVEEGEPEWREIPPIPGALVVNVGDTLQIISNGRYKSAEHRVRTTNGGSRVSIPLFTIPLSTQMIGPLPQLVATDGVARYRRFLFQDYFNNFFGQAHEGKKSLDFAKIT